MFAMARPETKNRDNQGREPGRATRRPIARAPANPLWSHLALGGGAQAKLRVNTPGDVYEQEADRVAEQVLAPRSFSPVRGLPQISHHVVQRACSCGGTCPRCQAASHLATDDARGGLAADPAGVQRGL